MMKFTKLKLGWHKHKSEIFLAAGIASFVASVPFWIKSTLKVNDVLDEAKQSMTNIKMARNDPDIKYSEEDAKKDTLRVFCQTSLRIARLYSIPFALGMFGGVCILTSHKILRDRNAAIAGAYTALDTGFREYRKRVVEKYGGKEDTLLRYDPDVLETHEVEVEDEKGKKKKTEVTEYEHIPDERLKRIDIFSRFFDEGNPYYDKNPGVNLAFLRSQQTIFNLRLQTEGCVFLNDIYGALGFPKTREGNEFGWIYEPNDPTHTGDNFIDFGLENIHDPKVREFLNAQERSFLLEFNVDSEPILYSKRLPMAIH